MAAASLVLLIVTSLLLLFDGSKSIDYQAVYNQFYSPVPYNSTTRTAGAEEENLIDAAYGLYHDKRYSEALELFNMIPEPVPNPAQYLYKGITVMELERYQEAISLFSQLESNPVFKHYGMWYTGLCYLALEDEQNARSTFKTIIEQEGYFMKEAKAVLKKI